jgi:hypothetical protein
MTQNPPPGWYPAQGQPGVERWWDGQQWTPGYRQAPAPTQPPQVPLPAGRLNRQTVPRFESSTGSALSPTTRHRWPWVVGVAVAVLIVLGLIGSLAKPPASKGAASTSLLSPSAEPATSTPTSASSPSSPSSSVQLTTGAPVSATPVPKKATTKPPVVVRATGALVVTAAGVVLPNPTRTPGATNPSVTQATIHHTICVSGWTSTIRPPSSYTTSLKERQLATGYAYRQDTSTGDYEEDHLISLELGGSATSQLNLWPEPYNAIDGARTKDRIENKLHQLVCSGAVSLSTAQHAIASNWWSAYEHYITTTTSTTPASAAPAPAPQPPAASAEPGNGATALCNDGSYSYAAHHQGACSHHGGVRTFYK